MKKVLLFLTVFIISIRVQGQVLTGKVVAVDNTPIPHASIYLKSLKDIVAFCFSGSDGNFRMDTKGKAYTEIEIRQMGYATKIISKEDFKNAQSIVLEEHIQKIREVIVKSDRIKLKGDTLDYLVSTFRGKQDRTIADVIKKMPGLTVNSDGTIEYQGQRINKFYIEGMDLLGSRYSQASENLDVRKVKKVQVLERHQPVRALKNVEFSGQAALNIVLSDSAKNVWSHIIGLSTGVSVEGGTDRLYDNRLLSMMFSRKQQSISMYKNNNTGKDIAREIAPSGYLAEVAPTDNGILENVSLSAPDINMQRSRYNNSHLFATNWLFKTHSGNDIRFQLNGIVDKMEQRQDRAIIYTAANNAENIKSTSLTSYHNAVSAELMYKQNTERQYLTNNVSSYVDFDRSSGIEILNGRNTRESVKPRQRYVSDKLSFVRNIGDRYSISTDAYLSWNDLPGSLLLTDSSSETLNKRSLLGGVDVHFSHKVGKLYLLYNVGTDFKIQKVHILHFLNNANQKYWEIRSAIAPALSYKSRLSDIKISVPLYLNNRHLEHEGKSNLTFEPSIFVSLLPASPISVTINYDYTWMPEDIARIISLPIYTDYISMSSGLGKLDQTTAHNIRTNLVYKDVAHGFFANVGYSFTNNRHQRLYSHHMNGDIYESFATNKTTNNTIHCLNGRISESWNGTAKLVTTMSSVNFWSNYGMLINDYIQRFQMRTSVLSTSVSTNPLDWISFEYHGSYLYSRQLCKTSGLDISPIRSFSHQLKCFFMPAAFQIEWNNELYHSNDKSVSFTYFSDLSVSYRSKRYEISISCNNLLGKEEYSRRQITDTQQMYTVTRIRPREIMAKIEFSF